MPQCNHVMTARGQLKYSEVPRWFFLFWLFGKKVQICLVCPEIRYFGEFD